MTNVEMTPEQMLELAYRLLTSVCDQLDAKKMDSPFAVLKGNVNQVTINVEKLQETIH